MRSSPPHACRQSNRLPDVAELQHPCLGCKLMNVLHTLTDILGNLILLQIQQTGVCRFDPLNQLRQLTNAVIGLRLCKDGRNSMEDLNVSASEAK